MNDLINYAQKREKQLEADRLRLQNVIHALTDIDIESRWLDLIVEYTRQRTALERIEYALQHPDYDCDDRIADIQKALDQLGERFAWVPNKDDL